MIISSYCRVSTDSTDQANSYNNQRSYFEREIVDKGHTVFKIYADKGMTGTKLNNRPEFEQMLKDAGIDIKIIETDNRDKRIKNRHTVYELSDRKPLFDEIWIKNTSRFARNTLSYEIINYLRQKHVNIFFVEQNINSSDMTQDLLLKLMQIFDEQDSKDKSLKVRTGIRESVKKGLIKTNSRLYGYKYIQAENKLEVIRNEAETIKIIFNLYIEGKGIRQIINYLNDNKLHTRASKPFCKSTIRRILDNEKYAGLNNALKYDTGAVMQKYSYPKVKDEYEVIASDKIEPIIDKELFYRCKELLKSKVNYKNQKGIYKGISKYSGMIYCGICGSVFHSNVDRGDVFYNCSNKKRNGVVACNCPNISERFLDVYMDELSDKWIGDTISGQKYYAFTVIYNLIRYKFTQLNKDRSLQAKNIEKEILEQQSILNNYSELYARTLTNKEYLLDSMDKVDKKIQSLNVDLLECTKDNDSIIEDITKLYDLHIQIQDMEIQDTINYKSKTQYTKEESFKMIEKIVISDKGKPFGIEAYIYKTQEIRDLIEEYRNEIDIKPVSPEEFHEIDTMLETVIDFV